MLRSSTVDRSEFLESTVEGRKKRAPELAGYLTIFEVVREDFSHLLLFFEVIKLAEDAFLQDSLSFFFDLLKLGDLRLSCFTDLISHVYPKLAITFIELFSIV